MLNSRMSYAVLEGAHHGNESQASCNHNLYGNGLQFFSHN